MNSVWSMLWGYTVCRAYIFLTYIVYPILWDMDSWDWDWDRLDFEVSKHEKKNRGPVISSSHSSNSLSLLASRVDGCVFFVVVAWDLTFLWISYCIPRFFFLVSPLHIIFPSLVCTCSVCGVEICGGMERR